MCVCMCVCHHRPHAIAHIVDALRANRLLQLRVLILAGNRVGEQGCQAVARYLSDSRSITQLTLARNPLGDAGVKQLAEVGAHTYTQGRTLRTHTGTHLN